MTVAQMNESPSPASEASTASANVVTRSVAEGQLLRELLLCFGQQESTAGFLDAVSGALARGLGLEGVLLAIRDGDGLRTAAAVGAGGEAEVVTLDLHAWPESASPFPVPAEAVSRLIPAANGQWRGVQCVPLRATARSPRGSAGTPPRPGPGRGTRTPARRAGRG